MFQRILFPTDGSPLALKACGVAVDMARRYGASLQVVSVIDPVPFVAFPEGGGEALAYYLEAAEQAANEGIAQARQLAEAAGVPFEGLILREHGPAVAVVEQAKAIGAELIVMGSHGRRGLDAVILGSVAQKVLTLSPVAVMIVK
ncbi:universal stress protein [Pelomonas sp. APW6]|uniref:Universal stress protein n=1 Tax=Roseateles subflavus TaxID=3053353 RepID=A0ABT7LIX9_9BURK|nr:universal stress protein [Pelomonas sp. APW6]MDL5031590.1 universal stress protein [Pelomonas sp. APW6]